MGVAKINKAVNKVTKAAKPMLAPSADFPIIGIGASAGGLEALELFFNNMPARNGMAFVIIQHLAPDYTGMLPELLQRHTSMKVTQATENLKLKPNCVYIIPPNKSMHLLKGALHLFAPLEVHGLRLPIDVFFNSMAADLQQKSIGIILSGMGSDGSLGVKAIKKNGGRVLVQDPETAKFNGMPNSALKAVTADGVDAADELPARLIGLLKDLRPALTVAIIEPKNESDLNRIIILLRQQTGHDFSMYKKNTLLRRVERRMTVHQIDKLGNYVRFLQENPGEINILFKEFLIGVTGFFRDAAVWKKLADVVLPQLFSQLPDSYMLRAWVPACSTGEEVFSLAIIFKEVLEKQKEIKHVTLQIFGTDLDVDAINAARKAVFSEKMMEDVSTERIKKYFTKVTKGFRVNTDIREMVIFAQHNIIKDPPFTKLDFLFCRNMLIYMEPELQKKIMSLFHYALNSEGVLLLGNSENDNSPQKSFIPIDEKLKIYKRSGMAKKTELIDFPSSFSPKMGITFEQVKMEPTSDNMQGIVDQLLLQNYAPASVMINNKGDILYISGRTGKYLEPAAGKANMNIYSMARQGLAMPLMGAIRNALQNYQPQILRNLKVGTNGGTQLVDVTVQHIDKPASVKGAVMIIFADAGAIAASEKQNSGKNKKTKAVAELEIELQHTTEELQNTREVMQTSHEELKSINEELQSSNEELQSANEELTTSREEMQSMNEELQTVNSELQAKIGEFLQADTDMTNLLNSTDIATLFLDKQLNIRRFTDETAKLMKLRPADIGRPFTELVSTLSYPDMADDAKKVLRTLLFKEIDITTDDQRWFKVRIMPYRTHNDQIEGVVITFFDISVAKKLEQSLSDANIDQRKKREAELVIANEKLIIENKEKEKRAAALVIANKKLVLENKEKQKLAAELARVTGLLKKHKLL